MLKLKRYLKPFALGVFITVVLIVIQAVADLNLPNYMSDIVNVGIQQRGIESGAPEVISADSYNLMKMFMSEEEQSLVDSAYETKSADDIADGNETYAEMYESAADTEFLVLDETLSSADLTDVENAFAYAASTMQTVVSLISEQSDDSTQSSDSSDLSDVDMTQLHALSAVVSTMPAEVIDDARETALKTDSSFLAQSSIFMVQLYYSEMGVDLDGMQTAYILEIGLVMLGIALISGASVVLISFFTSRIAAGVARNLRYDVFKKVESFSNAEFDKFSTASLITRSSNDVMQIQTLLSIAIRMIIYAPLLGIGGVIMAVDKSASMAWVIALSVVVLLGLIIIVLVAVIPKFKQLQKLVDKLNLVARETLNGLLVIRAFGQGNFEKKRFEEANDNFAKTNLFVNKTMAIIFPAMMFIMQGTTLLVIWIGSDQVAQSAMQVGDLMAFMQYSMQIIMAFLMVSMMFIFIPRASVSAERIAQVLDTENIILDPQNPKSSDKSKLGLVEFKNVNFKYQGASENALSNINFTAQPGQTTAFIGSTGSGKSTLLNLIPRFYDVTEGEIFVNGVNVRDLTQEELRGYIGYVPQKSVLMSGSIESNIKYGGDNITSEMMNKAAKIAQSEDFIMQKEDGFDSHISQGGSNVSGGQRQRLSIARALAINPKIFIFDDSFSALDFKTDAALRKALKENTGDATVIIVAQRVSTIMEADKIHVLNDGVITASGTHKELLKTSEEYYEIAATQLSKEELENE